MYIVLKYDCGANLALYNVLAEFILWALDYKQKMLLNLYFCSLHLNYIELNSSLVSLQKTARTFIMVNQTIEKDPTHRIFQKGNMDILTKNIQ